MCNESDGMPSDEAFEELLEALDQAPTEPNGEAVEQEKTKKSTWKSHSSRVSALVHEIDVLQRQLRAHHADKLLRESLDRLLDIQRDWSKIASREQRSREISAAENDRLRARMAGSLKLGKRVQKLLKRQLSIVSVSFTCSIRDGYWELALTDTLW